MKSIYIYSIFSILLLGCTKNKVNELTGSWKIDEVDRSNFKSLLAIPHSPPSAYDFPKYDSHQKPVTGNLFYLAKEDNATIEFKNDKSVKTTLFFANYGKKMFEYYPAIDTLQIKFVNSDTTISGTSEQIIYEGRFSFHNNNTAIWELANGIVMRMSKER